MTLEGNTSLMLQFAIPNTMHLNAALDSLFDLRHEDLPNTDRFGKNLRHIWHEKAELVSEDIRMADSAGIHMSASHTRKKADLHFAKMKKKLQHHSSIEIREAKAQLNLLPNTLSSIIPPSYRAAAICSCRRHAPNFYQNARKCNLHNSAVTAAADCVNSGIDSWFL